MTYKQAYDKIIDAYFRDEIRPYVSEFCFCGTLAGDASWDKNPNDTYQVINGYSIKEYKRMERALMVKLGVKAFTFSWLPDTGVNDSNPEYEAALFAGMSAALDVLKQIHIERGEVIDEVPVFTKRQLAKPEPDKSDKKVRV